MSEQASDIPPELEEKLSELSILQQALEESKKKSAEYYDQLLRLRAEFDNFRKRSEKEKSDARSWGKQDVLMPLLGIVDVFEQALTQAQKAKDTKQIVQGLEFLHKNFAQFLKSEGIEPLHVVGKDFDPHLAEVIDQKEVAEEEVGKVLGEIQKGYSYNGKVLRPSRVRVGVAPAEHKNDEATNEEELDL
jgi:molecular chaperone GrpE